MINFGAILMPQPPLYRSTTGSCTSYTTPTTDFSNFSTASTENSRRFSVNSLLELEDLHSGRAEDTDNSESRKIFNFLLT